MSCFTQHASRMPQGHGKDAPHWALRNVNQQCIEDWKSTTDWNIPASLYDPDQIWLCPISKLAQIQPWGQTNEDLCHWAWKKEWFSKASQVILKKHFTHITGTKFSFSHPNKENRVVLDRNQKAIWVTPDSNCQVWGHFLCKVVKQYSTKNNNRNIKSCYTVKDWNQDIIYLRSAKVLIVYC